jgi:hypothetical protein
VAGEQREQLKNVTADTPVVTFSGLLRDVSAGNLRGVYIDLVTCDMGGEVVHSFGE